MTPIWVLLGVNFIVFIAALINEARITSLLGLMPATFLDEPWTIVTSMFVHAGFGHILFNMLMLYFFGSYFLGLVGESKFLIVYFVGGLAGNVLFMLIGPSATLIGASGALYALMGTLAVMRPKLKVLLYFLIPVDLWIVVIFASLIMIPMARDATRQGTIAWEAHLGGLVAGLVAGYYFRRRERGAFRR